MVTEDGANDGEEGDEGEGAAAGGWETSVLCFLAVSTRFDAAMAAAERERVGEWKEEEGGRETEGEIGRKERERKTGRELGVSQCGMLTR